MSIGKNSLSGRIGITGTIGSGKSSVGSILCRCGFPVLDADACVHELYRECGELREKLSGEFGAECLDPNGVNRLFFAGLIFKDSSARQKLESLVYPYLEQRVLQFFGSYPKLAFLEAAVLHRTPGIVKQLDQVWLVDAPAEIRLQRLELRGLSREDAQRRMETQGNLSAFWADTTLPVVRLNNGGTLEELKTQVERLMAP